jgi:hypothetical protein
LFERKNVKASKEEKANVSRSSISKKKVVTKDVLKNMMCNKKDKILEHLGLLIVKIHLFI